jgi:hypothetical protein
MRPLNLKTYKKPKMFFFFFFFFLEFQMNEADEFKYFASLGWLLDFGEILVKLC